MANVPIKDGAAADKYLKSSGAGSDGDPYIPQHLETNSAAILTSTQLIDDAIATAGSAITAKGNAVAGTDGTNARIIKTDTSGELQIDVLTITAGETHVGEVAGSGAAVAVAPTVSTSPAYTAGDSIGGKITIAAAVRVSGGISILNSIQILDRANQKPTGTILIFNADPTNATITDNAAFVFSTDDLKVVATIPIASSDWTTINSKAVAQVRGLAAEVKTASGTSLYAAFVVTSTPTFVATTDVNLVFGLVYVN